MKKIYSGLFQQYQTDLFIDVEFFTDLFVKLTISITGISKDLKFSITSNINKK